MTRILVGTLHTIENEFEDCKRAINRGAFRKQFPISNHAAMRAFLCLLLLAVTPGCDFLTDAATRAAYEIEAATHEMRRQGLASYEFTHVPKTWPEGVDGPWDLVIHESSQIGQGGLGLGRYATGYHNRFVRVPRTLSVTKQAGEGCVIMLRRDGDAIELVGLR